MTRREIAEAIPPRGLKVIQSKQKEYQRREEYYRATGGRSSPTRS
jgi:hypothetical protein